MSALSIHAQEMEPRAYSAVPVATNFAVSDYARSSGDVSFDPSLPITNVQAHINIFSLGYSHSFGVAGRTVSTAVSVPYANANANGDVKGVFQQQYRSGLGDVHFKIAANLLGDPALSPEEFVRRAPSTIRCHAVRAAGSEMVRQTRVVAWPGNACGRQFPDNLDRASIPLVQLSPVWQCNCVADSQKTQRLTPTT
ncbi:MULTISPECIES: hypothetical protein [Paraburkholderia]|uniref:hypothetical protein n=1 Tax=Paraburkholderia TaxID=1822464 RepID=UPI00224F12BB|nr:MULTISPECIES: hypothetical protein [Paraburkholderia]MCX4174700.1 hypothetical protein [Paraburkholderia madseniana]MDQ6462701.1 hypothetical protein [Paraburkholderia madseniana]